MFIVIPTLTSASAMDDLHAKQGHIRITKEQLEQNGTLTLDGEWEFYWQKLLTPDDLRMSDSTHTPVLISVPGSWANSRYDAEQYSKYGYATYRLVVHLDESLVGKVFSLYIPNVATAYQLWINNEQIGSNGIVGTSRESMIPKNYAKVVTFQANNETIELLIQVSSYHQRKAGIWESISFGTADRILSLRVFNLIFQSIVIGAILIMGLHHLVLFFFRRKEYPPLLLAIACFAVAIRTLLLKDAILVHLFPQISWELAVTLEYISALVALLSFLLFIRLELFPNFSIKIVRILVLVISLYGGFILFTPPYIFTSTFPFYQSLVLFIMTSILITSVLAVYKKKQGSYINLTAMLVLFLAILNDLLYFGEWISTDEFVSLGLLFYLFMQSFHISRRISRSFDRVDCLSKKLKELNHSLELQVEQRTQELREVNDSLQKIEQSRKRLFASVSHELKTPLTFIQGYIKAMIDGVVSKDDSSLLRTVYSDTQMMTHMINDLQELSSLESGHVSLQYTEVDVRSYMQQLFHEQRSVIHNKGLQYDFIESGDYAFYETKVMCLIDPIRVKQVYLNFLVNAQNHTPVGGRISVEVDVPSRSNRNEIKVAIRDTGQGIADKDLPHVFERFYKVNRIYMQQERRAGLGLAIVREIIEEYHQGTVGVQSAEGQGSIFYFTLPIHRILKK